MYDIMSSSCVLKYSDRNARARPVTHQPTASIVVNTVQDMNHGFIFKPREISKEREKKKKNDTVKK